jgi:deoxyribose-phosphate aldolase
MRPMEVTYDLIASRIDHSLLGPTLTQSELRSGCELAARYGVASVCIKPYAVPLARGVLAGTKVAVGTTIGFPHGGHSTETKLDETLRALDAGATELDMVVNIGQVLGDEWAPVRDEIAAIVESAHARDALVKVIFENCYLGPNQITRLCHICGEVNADFVKTSTGYGTGGATRDDLILMRQAAPSHVRLKAAGGVRTLDALIEVVGLGCDRVGLSRTSELLDELKLRLLSGPPMLLAHATPPGGSKLGSGY